MLTLSRICEIIKSNDKISDFRIVETDKQSNELFFVHGKLETARRADSHDALVTAYVDHGGKRGSSSFSLNASLSEDELGLKLSEAISQALLINDEPYVLPDNETCNIVIASNLDGADPTEVGAKVAKAVYEANKYDDCDINALEVFVVKNVNHVVNSRGIDKTQTKYKISIEAIPTCNGKDGSVELFEAYDLAELDVEWIKKEIAARIEDVRARLVAEKPKTKLDCPVVFNAYELQTLFNAIVTDINYANIYNHANLHSVGDALQDDLDADRFTITMRGMMKDSPAGSHFDLDGTNLSDREIVRDGRIVAGYGSHRFASYLGKTPTGALNCIDVNCGKLSDYELSSEPHLELVFLSGLQVDLLSDYIGGEIRLAYYYDGVDRVPVTGVAMSGKLSEVLNTAKLGSERTVLGNYAGPAKIQFEKLNIF